MSTLHNFPPLDIESGAPTVYAVYGTLMEGGALARMIANLGQYGPRVEITGARLYNVGWFPALLSGDGIVQAQLWRPYPGREVEAQRRLDDIEGCRGRDTGLYVRRPMALADGTQATVYVWNGSADGLAPIPSGDWRDVKRDRGDSW